MKATMPNELHRFVSTTENALDQAENEVDRWQYRRILRETLQKFEAIAQRGKELEGGKSA